MIEKIMEMTRAKALEHITWADFAGQVEALFTEAHKDFLKELREKIKDLPQTIMNYPPDDAIYRGVVLALLDEPKTYERKIAGGTAIFPDVRKRKRRKKNPIYLDTNHQDGEKVKMYYIGHMKKAKALPDRRREDRRETE